MFIYIQSLLDAWTSPFSMDEGRWNTLMVIYHKDMDIYHEYTYTESYTDLLANLVKFLYSLDKNDYMIELKPGAYRICDSEGRLIVRNFQVRLISDKANALYLTEMNL